MTESEDLTCHTRSSVCISLLDHDSVSKHLARCLLAAWGSENGYWFCFFSAY